MSEPASPTRLIFVEEGGTSAAGLSPNELAWVEANGFTGQRGRLLPLPHENGGIGAFVFGTGDASERTPLVSGLAGAAVPPGHYALAGAMGDPTLAALGFRLGAYRFDRYRKVKQLPTLALPAPSTSQPAYRSRSRALRQRASRRR